MRNEEVLGKDKATKQQKRKVKAAITVRTLHKLEEQARPSNSILFFSDVEELIKHATATTLEVFIAVKTKPIYNSVRKWAKRSTGKVKSIVEGSEQGE